MKTCLTSHKGKNMKMNFCGNRKKLKKVVAQTGLNGGWKKLPNGTWQYVTENGGILNWYRSTGNVWFQGEDVARVVFERKFKKAAKDRVEQRQNEPQDSPEKKVGWLDCKKTLRRLSKKMTVFDERWISNMKT